MKRAFFYISIIIVAFMMTKAEAAPESRLGEKREKLCKIWGEEGKDMTHPDGTLYTEWKKPPFKIQAFFTPLTNVCYMLYINRGFDPEKKQMTRDEALELVKQFTNITFRVEKKSSPKTFTLKRNNIVAYYRWEDYGGMCMNIVDKTLEKKSRDEWAQIKKRKEKKEAENEAKRKSDSSDVIKNL